MKEITPLQAEYLSLASGGRLDVLDAHVRRKTIHALYKLGHLQSLPLEDGLMGRWFTATEKGLRALAAFERRAKQVRSLKTARTAARVASR
jgi:hypothetical protein